MRSFKEERVIFPLTKEILPTIARLETLCFSEPWSETSLEILTKDGGFGVAILRDGEAVAYGGMTTVLDEGAVTNIATHPELRRQGLGRRVLRELLRKSEEKGITTVFLEVRESNLAAKRLYESEGFIACGVRKNFYRLPTESAIQMVRHANQTND